MLNKIMGCLTLSLGVLTASAQAPFQPPPRLNLLTMDDPGREWCYLAKSTTVIGLPFQPDVTSVTYDGALYTGYAEMDFFYGRENLPLVARQKTFYRGWIPLVEYGWSHEGVRYDLEMFADSLDGRDVSNTVNFIRVRMRNPGKVAAEGRVSVALRGKLEDFRFGDLKDFSPADLYEMKADGVWKNGRLMYAFPAGGRLQAVPGQPYHGPFRGSDFGITAITPSAIVTYSKRLSPGQSEDLVFKMPRVPVSDPGMVSEVRKADYGHYRDETIRYWEGILDGPTRYEIPEKRVENAQRAGMVHLLLATRTMPDGHRTQTDGLPYPMFFLTSAPQMDLAYLTAGLPEQAKLSVLNSVREQEPDGLYFDRSLAHGGVIPTAHGHVLYALTSYYLFTRDTATMRSIWPSIKRAIAYLDSATAADRYGLLPAAYPYDNEMIDGHYASNNFWALLGLRFAIRLARDLGEAGVAQQWTRLEARYRASILKGIYASARPGGYVPPGLYPYLTGRKARRGFAEYQTDNDWENMLLAYPTEILSPDDSLVTGTLRHVRKGYAEGIMTFRHGQHLHQYITANMIEQYMVRGESRQALIDFYHLLVHSGSTQEEFENLVVPWSDRQVEAGCPPPHAWAAGKTAYLIRNFLVHEYGGEAGLDESRRTLDLFSVVSPAWAYPGARLAVRHAPTEMGYLDASMTFSTGGAVVDIHSPAPVRIRVPYFKELISFSTDASRSSSGNGWINLSADVRRVTIRWKERPGADRGTFGELLLAYRSTNYLAGIDSAGVPIVRAQKPFLLESERGQAYQPLSFDFVQRTFLYEFNRRVRAAREGQVVWYRPRAVGGVCAPDPSAIFHRLPAYLKDSVRPVVWSLSLQTAGEFVDFRTDAGTIRIQYGLSGPLSMPHMPETGVSGVALWAKEADGTWAWAPPLYRFGDTVTYTFGHLHFPHQEEATYRLYLPLYNTVTWLRIGVGGGSAFTFLPLPGDKPIVAYGTSILQGAVASRPDLAWSSILERRLNRTVINLGFSGNGQIEKPIIDLMAGVDASLYIIDCMPNLTATSGIPQEEVARRVRYAVARLRRAHPGVPILFAEHSGGFAAGFLDTARAWEYRESSRSMARIFEDLRRAGIGHIRLLKDSDIHFGVDCTTEGLHPNDIGMTRYADAYERVIRKILPL